MTALAYLFRTLNARLIGQQNWLIQKLIKISLACSLFFLRQKFLLKNNSWVVIDNFDRNKKLKIDASRSMGRAFFWTGFHELNELLFLHNYLRPDMVFIDVGANIGEYTLFAAGRLPQGKVYSFEPMPTLFQQLRENCSLNHFSNISLLNYGLSDQRTTLQAPVIDDEHEGLFSLYRKDASSANSLTIPVQLLDETVEELSLSKIDVVKIDIEGSELAALQGGLKAIKKWRPLLLVEINKITFESAGYLPEDIFNLLLPLGYRAYQIEKAGKLTPLAHIPDFQNIVFK